ncbi:MAG: penicillin-binding transpeptidase domain-containing protein [Thermoleophilaceae bacterium]
MEATTRRQRLVRHGLPALAGLAGAALVAGLAVAALGDSDGERAGREFAEAWADRDYERMHGLFTPGARERVSVQELGRAYSEARGLATIVSVSTGEPEEDGDGVRIPSVITTRAFGTISGDLVLPVADGALDWRPDLVLPGMPPGSTLSRRTEAPPRAGILARDGQVLAEGPADARSTPLGATATNIVGQLAPAATPDEERALFARGFPEGTPIGRTGLERILEEELAGTPGGTLLAGGRVLGQSEPKAAEAVRTTIDVDVQAAAVQALGGRLGGIAALDARTAEVRALAGIAFSAPQPPGSIFKIITTTAALEEDLVESSTRFPVETKAVIDGVDLENANGESCGGTFENSFAHSCNSVFAPLGIRIGAEKLVATAERYGFNAEPSLAGAAPSTMPEAGDIGSPLELGASAIGQGRLLVTPLLMASVAQTVASEGVRRTPTVLPVEGTPAGERVTSRSVARTLERLMIGVVESGTGRLASLAPVKVAGKTGTAELEDTTDDEDGEERDPDAPPKPPGYDTDAWFTAYAPSRRPELAVTVLLVRNGAGGDTAAPAAKIVLQAGLRG